jgi:hypothetical protein
MKHDLLWLLGLVGFAWWLSRRKPPDPIEIPAVKTSVGQLPSIDDQIGLFDFLFGRRDAEEKLPSWYDQNFGVGLRNPRYGEHGWWYVWDVQSEADVGGPKFLIDKLTDQVND